MTLRSDTPCGGCVGRIRAKPASAVTFMDVIDNNSRGTEREHGSLTPLCWVL